MLAKNKSNCGSHAVVTSSSRSGRPCEDQRMHSSGCLAYLSFWKAGLTQQHPAGQFPVLHCVFPTENEDLHPAPAELPIYTDHCEQTGTSNLVMLVLPCLPTPDDSRKFQFSNLLGEKKIPRACLILIYSQILYFQAFSAVFYLTPSEVALLERQQLFPTCGSQHT